MTLVARHAALSDVGLHRKTNEDSFVVEPPLYAVCDGMGGAQAGEVASGLAAETLAREVRAGTPLRQAAEAANAAVFARAGEDPARRGMGTTLTALLLAGTEGRFVHVGDSRAYLLRDGELAQLTDDHSLVGEMVREGRLTPQEAAAHPHRSILSRALGTEPSVRIDEFAAGLRPGDVLLLCSDGLSGVVADDVLARHLAGDDPAAAARGLIREARTQGGPDNITAVVLRLDDADGHAGDETGEAVEIGLEELQEETAAVAARPRPGPSSGDDVTDRFRRAQRRLGLIAAVLAVVVLLALAGALTMSVAYFVGVDDGLLVVYSGLPVSVGPLDLHVPFRRSGVAYDSLSPEAKRIVDARRVGTRAEVLALAADLGMWP